MALCGVAACFFATSLARAGVDTPAHQVQSHVVRLAELQIDPSSRRESKVTYAAGDSLSPNVLTTEAPPKLTGLA